MLYFDFEAIYAIEAVLGAFLSSAFGAATSAEAASDFAAAFMDSDFGADSLAAGASLSDFGAASSDFLSEAAAGAFSDFSSLLSFF